MKKRYIITVITSILMVVLIAGIQKIILEKKKKPFCKSWGFVCRRFK